MHTISSGCQPLNCTVTCRCGEQRGPAPPRDRRPGGAAVDGADVSLLGRPRAAAQGDVGQPTAAQVGRTREYLYRSLVGRTREYLYSSLVALATIHHSTVLLIAPLSF